MTTLLVLATHNPGKVAELRRILGEVDVRLLDAGDVELPDVEETGTTFEENALLKARAGATACGLPCVADDSGLVVDALGGAPGVRSARYAGAHGDDEANLRLVLDRMAGVADRAARFVCVAALVDRDGREWTTEGVVEGRLIHAPRGTGGFGYDPIFVPLGEERTTAEMPPQDKDAISHRGQAFRALRPVVEALSDPSPTALEEVGDVPANRSRTKPARGSAPRRRADGRTLRGTTDGSGQAPGRPPG